MQLSVQLFTLRRDIRRNLYASLERLSVLGFKNVEAARLPFDAASAEVFARARRDFDIRPFSSQIKIKYLEGAFDDVVRWHKATGCEIATLSVMPYSYILNIRPFSELALRLNRLSAAYAEQGIVLGYHHHDFEFVQGERRGAAWYKDAFQAILGETDMPVVLDTFWAHKAGHEPAKLLDALKGRVVGLHLRDYGVVWERGAVRAKDFPLGSGSLDIAGILAAAQRSGARYFAIEHDSKNPFSDLAASVAYLRHIDWKEAL